MKILLIRHTRTAEISIFERWARQHSHQLRVMSVCRKSQDAFPALSEFDALITTGGSQSATKLSEYPALQQEVQFLQQVVARQKPTLGICLGGQLLGLACGAKAQVSPEPEFGYYPVMLTEYGRQDPLFSEFPSEFMSLHWHNDMMGQPNGAAVLATSAGCPVQAVRFQDKVYGIQFHWDFTKAVLLKNLKKRIDSDLHHNFVQPAEEMLTADFALMEASLFKVLSKLFPAP